MLLLNVHNFMDENIKKQILPMCVSFVCVCVCVCGSETKNEINEIANF